MNEQLLKCFYKVVSGFDFVNAETMQKIQKQIKNNPDLVDRKRRRSYE